MKNVRINNMNRRAFVGLGALTTLGALSGCLGRGFAREVEVSETFERSYAASEVDELRIESAIGTVLVTGSDGDTVDAEIRKRSWNGQRGLDAIQVRTDVESGTLTVTTQMARDATFTRRSPMADIVVTVPRGEAGPQVTDVVSDLGDVTLLGTRGDSVVQTSAGNIVASDVDGYLSLRSDLGSIEAADVSGIDRITTNAGRIKVDLLSVRGDVDVGTDLGEVVVGVADGLDLDVVAESSGDVSSDLALSDVRSGGGRYAGRLNAGGHRLHVFSDLGAVSLRRF